MSLTTAADEPDRRLTASERQAQRMGALPAIYTTPHERLAYELALQMEDPAAVFVRFGYTSDQAMALLGTPSFAALLDRVSKEVKDNGVSFRLKARAQAEELLGNSYEIATDPEAPFAVRADLIKWTAKIAGLEPKPETGEQQTGGFSLTIQFSGQAPQQVVSADRAPVVIENGEG